MPFFYYCLILIFIYIYIYILISACRCCILNSRSVPPVNAPASVLPTFCEQTSIPRPWQQSVSNGSGQINGTGIPKPEMRWNDMNMCENKLKWKSVAFFHGVLDSFGLWVVQRIHFFTPKKTTPQWTGPRWTSTGPEGKSPRPPYLTETEDPNGAGNANMTGVYWWDPWHTIYGSTMDPSWVMSIYKCIHSVSWIMIIWWSPIIAVSMIQWAFEISPMIPNDPQSNSKWFCMMLLALTRHSYPHSEAP